MTLEAGKEMDRRCVMNWLIEVYRNPTVAFNTHSDEQQIEFAHDALVLLKEQEVMTPDEFKSGLMEMFSSIWESEIDHPIFQDTVGELMEAAIQLYKKAVKWER